MGKNLLSVALGLGVLFATVYVAAKAWEKGKAQFFIKVNKGGELLRLQPVEDKQSQTMFGCPTKQEGNNNV